MSYDFCGWATKNDILCSDGRTIRKGAFKDNDGQTVPLVWNHCHNDPGNVLGHALLENRDDGVYAYATFNDTESGKTAKDLVSNGDITHMSIYANKLRQNGKDVMHGVIREVSLVLAGANPGALIDSVVAHGEEDEESAVIYNDEHIELSHADDEENSKSDNDETIADVINTFNEKQKTVLYALIEAAINGEIAEHSGIDEEFAHADESDTKEDGSEETVADVLDTLSEKQKTVVYALIDKALKENNGGNDNMKHNVFEPETEELGDVLTHSEMKDILADGKRYGSLRESVLQHGIEEISTLFPDDKAISNVPEFIKREDGWVDDVMNSVHRTPFSRIKSLWADITEDEARAKGYIKDNMKLEEFFSVAKRSTGPCTIYKKQKLAKDDVDDITDFDVVAWLKKEMRMMLNEEIARAILIGDGRPSSSDDKIDELCIRPIWTDHDVFTVKKLMTVAAGATDDQKAKQFIKTVIKSRKDYKGSGNPTLYLTEDLLTDCLLMEDTQGRVIYDTEEKLRTALRVKKIVTVPVMENQTRTVGAATHTLQAIMVNLSDYNVGADKGGSINMFDDFDIDYNAQKYLIETRCSGALIKPYSAVVFESKPAAV